MNLRHALSVLLTCIKLGYRRSMASKTFVAGSFITYTVLMLVYVSIIKMIPEGKIEPFGLNHLNMIWYMATAEMMVFMGSAWAYKELQNEFTEGTVYTSLIRPSSYMLVRIGIWLGEAITRTVFIVPYYLCIITLLSGAFIMRWHDVALLFVALPLSMLMVTCAAYAVGSSCLWLIQSEPVHWLWEKAVFLLGCMLWPMSLYPLWLKALCWLTPFPGILAIGARNALAPGGWVQAAAFLHQILWAGLFLLFMRWLDRRILTRIQSGEG